MHHHQLTRVSPTELRVDHPYAFPARLFATPEVTLERRAVDELLRLLDLQGTLERLSTDSRPAHIERVALTPDFHKGAGIPVGTVMQGQGFMLPQAIGNDVGCGMSLHTTGLSREALEPRLEVLESRFRHSFFQGGRDLPLTGLQREALLREGVAGLIATRPTSPQGLWRQVQLHELEQAAAHTESGGLPVRQLHGLNDWIGEAGRLSWDGQSGSLGGGNHFLELQYVHRVLDAPTAHAWGLREGQVTVMVHSGSLGIGHLAGQRAFDLAKSAYPAGLARPANGFFPLLTGEQNAAALQDVQDALNTAANFAAVNRLFLALMAKAVLQGACGEFEFPLLYDAAHNFIWREGIWQESERWLHRKGATPARGYEAMQGTPFAYTGEPVLVPGSMGASSFVLAGQGHPEALHSASHGAGRRQARGEAMHANEAEFEQFLKEFRVVTPLDWRRARADVREQKLAELKQEAPFAYKGIGPVVQTLEQAGLARPVAELRPLLTVKG
ncbi:RtcB family protein [Deinococcus altitudinis]|uniref:RtcB family protein n=1 Tax=Deinococcus altitudinis TaxID=468914 RepID=UPI0038921B0E